MARGTPGPLLKATPNALSALRLALAIAFPFLPPARWPAAVIVAGLSDTADGTIARRYGATSWAGGILDGVADKAFVLSALFTMVLAGRLFAWQLVPLLLRDIIVVGIAAFSALTARWQAFKRIKARWPGKLTTLAIFALFALLLLWPEARGSHVAVFVTASLLSALAAGDYAAQAMAAWRKEKQGRATA